METAGFDVAPSRERELKPSLLCVCFPSGRVAPSRERELKLGTLGATLGGGVSLPHGSVN